MLKHAFKKAPQKGAFFAFLLFLFPVYIHAENCTYNSLLPLERVKVKWVYDGDSLLLTDKRKIRIIGIDTPETKHHKQKAQAYGAKAREALRALLKTTNYQVMLQYGKERFDKYSRTLAHVYLLDGTNISSWMLERGFAKTLAFPPNIKLAGCYKKREGIAQAKLLRIWRYKSNQVKEVNSLPRHISGYVRLRGKVFKIKNHKKSLVIELASKMKSRIQVRIKNSNLHYFNKIDPKKLMDKTIIVTGILKNKKRKRTLYLSHSSQLDIVEGSTKDKQQMLSKQPWKKSAIINWSLQK